MGLFDTKFGNLADIEIDLNTCELYQCQSCSHKENNVYNIKRHAKTVHGVPSVLDHHKTSRDNREEISENVLWFSVVTNDEG